jgi:divalent metal cation (Fe/Co/Zn/Cd) transporter
MIATIQNRTKDELLKLAYVLSLITIIYNIMEGGIATFFGMGDETLALFGFGVDSFVEVVSGVGIAHMLLRMKRSSIDNRDKFEKTALKVTGTVFYVLVVGLIFGSIMSIYSGQMPETTMIGIMVSSVSIITMYFLYRYKLETGKLLDSPAIISDANCTKTCFYLSFILLGSSMLYEFLHIPYVDAIGSLGIAWYAFKEGREAFEKVRSGNLACCEDCH